MLTGLRLFEIAVFLYLSLFWINHTTTTLTTMPTIATNYNHEPTTLKPLTTTTTTIFATIRAYEHRPPRTTRRRFPWWKPSKNARRIAATKALAGPAWNLPPVSPAYFLPRSDSRPFSPRSGWGRCDPSRGQRSCKGGASFWGNNSLALSQN